MISKEDILAKVSSYDILIYYLAPYSNNRTLRQGTLISNPFLSRKQRTPSFNICNKYGEWRYKDFATDDKGSCFDLVMNLFNLSFTEAIARINQDMILGLDNERKIQTKASQPSLTPLKKKKPYLVVEKNFNALERSYWGKYGIELKHLSFFNVVSIKSYSFGENKYYAKSYDANPIFAYKGKSWYKIYRPKDKKFKFLFLGTRPGNYIFGYSQLPWIGSKVYITGGEKDVVSLYAHGKSAISLNSETASISPLIIKQLKGRFKHVVVLYDNDETGIKFSQKLVDKYNIIKGMVPEGYNDVSDYFSTTNPVV